MSREFPTSHPEMLPRPGTPEIPRPPSIPERPNQPAPYPRPPRLDPTTTTR